MNAAHLIDFIVVTSIFALSSCAGEGESTGGASTPDPKPGQTSPIDAGGGPAAEPVGLGRASFVVWQGMEHHWLRQVAGFSIAHRMSKLASYVGSYADDARPHGAFVFAHGTGVDGNYMRPVGHYAVVHADGVLALESEATFSWTDDIGASDPPQARTTRTAEVIFDAPALGTLGADATVDAILRGFALETHCDDAKQPAAEPCNSDGLWPYDLDFEVKGCVRESAKARCRVDVAIGRAWTPSNGGVPVVAEKPLNAHLDYDLKVKLTLLAADRGVLCVKRLDPWIADAELHLGAPEADQTLEGEPGAPEALVAMTRVGVRLKKREPNSPERLGRYVGGIDFVATDGTHDAWTGRLQTKLKAGAWSPLTVANSGMEVVLTPSIIQLGEKASPHVMHNQSIEAWICENSHGAPIWSTWTKCKPEALGAQQDADTKPIDLVEAAGP